MSNKSLFIIFMTLFSMQALGKKEVFSQKSQSFYENVQLLIDATRSKLILENVGSETQLLIKQLESSLPDLKLKVKQESRRKGQVSHAQSLLWQAEAEIQAFETIKRESKDPSRALIRKQMLWDKLLRTFLLLEEESRKDLLSLLFSEGELFLVDLIKEVSNLDLTENEEDGIYYISVCLSRWSEKAQKEREDLEREREAKAQGFPVAQPILRRQDAIVLLPRRPDSVNKGYVPEM